MLQSYVDEMLEIVQHADEMTTSDLQGVVEAFVLKVWSNKND